jgi:hypothetical protein
MNRIATNALLAALILKSVALYAQVVVPLPPETRIVAASGAPAPTQQTFTIASAQDLVVTLTDLQVPDPVLGASVVVTQGAATVATASLAPPATTATLNLPGAVGTYTLYVFGTPNASVSVGTFTVCVAPQSSPSSCIQDASLAGNITAPSAAADPTISTLDATFTVATSGTYTVPFADDQFPTALASAPNLAIFQGSAIVGTNIASGSTFNLSPGTYTLLAIAQADPTVMAGLYGITISGPAGVSTPLSDSYPVGALSAAVLKNNPSAQSLALKVTDFSFPAALASAAGLVTLGGSKLGAVSLSAAASSFQAPAGTVKVWTYATAGADAGTYEVTLGSAAGNLLELPLGVNSATSQAFAFLAPVLAAGPYQATATDFQFPAALQALQFAVAQGGSILATESKQGTVNFTTTAAGSLVLLVDATPTTSAAAQANGNGLVDVNVQSTGASPQLLYDMTQGVSQSGLLDSQTIQLGVSADFDVTLADLKFPDPFSNLALVVSNGGSVLGKIFGGGTFSFSAAPGPYKVTFIATPAAGQQYGLYGLQIVYTPPTVMLTATPTSVSAGATTTLNWSSTDATACTATGAGFAGAQTASGGSLAVQVSQTTTYTLTCTGPGGSAMQSATVNVTAAPGSGGGGGGLDSRFIVALLLLTCAARFRSRRAS